MFTNNLVMFSFRYLTKILVGDQLQQGVLELFMVIQEPERKFIPQHSCGVKLGGSRLNRVDLDTELYKKTSVQCLVQCFRSIVKDQIVWYAQVHNTRTCLSFMFWFSVFGLTDLGFHEQIESTSLHGLMYIRFVLYTCMLQLFIQTQFDNLFMYLGFVF